MLRNFTVFTVLLVLLPFSTAAYAIAGKFQFVNGEVVVIDATGKQRVAKKGEAIDVGETVSSMSNGFAQIKMEDGGYFAVRADTQFKVDTFKFEGKEDGSERGLFTLIKGSLRSVTGLVGRKHKDNYRIQTATATIGIRGSGADIGHDASVGTAVRTLFGGHSLTSNGKTVETRPGQTALAAPGQPPAIVPSFPFTTNTTAGTGQEKQGVKAESEQPKSEAASDKESSNTADATTTKSTTESTTSTSTSGTTTTTAATPVVASSLTTGPIASTSTIKQLTSALLTVVIPILTTNNTNLTTNTTSSGTAITPAATPVAGDQMPF